MSTPGECPRAWPRSAARYAIRPPLAITSGTAHISTPMVKVMALPSSAPAAPRPARCTSTSASSGSVSQSACERMPIASAARNAPSTIILPEPASAAGSCVPGSCAAARTPTRAPLAPPASCARPGMSLIGRPRVEPEQRRLRRRAASPARRGDRARHRRPSVQRFEASEDPHQRKDGERAEERAQQRKRPRVGRHNGARQSCRAR